MNQIFTYADLPGDTLLTADQAAEVLAVSKATLARWRSEGRPKPAYSRIGRWAVRYPLGSLRDYINDNRSDKAAAGGQ